MSFLLLIPFFLIRFLLLSLLNKDAIKRAANFAPLLDNEKVAYWLYQISNIAIVVCLFFLKITSAPTALFCMGAVMYVVGTILLIASVVSFAAPAESGINQNGLYRLSRNPMYVAYFLFFFGCALLTQSLILFMFVLIFKYQPIGLFFPRKDGVYRNLEMSILNIWNGSGGIFSLYTDEKEH